MRKIQTKSTGVASEHALSLKENGVFSWRLVAVLSLMGCIAVEVLFNLMPIDHDTVLLYWFFPVSLLLLSQLYFHEHFTRHFEIKLLIAFLLWGWWLRRRIGGISGDGHGAGIEMTESGLLLAALVWAHIA